MKKQFSNPLRVVVGIFMVLIAIGSMFGILFPLTSLGAIKANLLAAAAQTVSNSGTSTATADAASSNLLLPDISKVITKMQPDLYPLDTILRNIGETTPSPAWETKYYSVGSRGVEDTITTGVAVAGASGATKDIVVGNVKLWQVDDVMLVNGIAGDDGDLTVIITAVAPSTSTLTIFAINSGTGGNLNKIPVIADATKITNIGNSKDEDAAQTTPFGIYPIDEYNYNQIHMSQVKATVYEKLHKKEVNWDIHDMQAMSVYSFRQRCELTSMFGSRRKVTMPDGSVRYFSHGITRYLTKYTDYDDTSTGIDNDWFIDLGKDVFSGNNGSNNRVVFASPYLMAKFQKVPTIQKQLEAKSTEIVLGVVFHRVETAFGSFLLKMHNGFDFVPKYAKRGVVLDVNYLEKHVFKALETRELDLKKSGQANSDAYVMDEAFCTITRFPDLHRIIKVTGTTL